MIFFSFVADYCMTDGVAKYWLYTKIGSSWTRDNGFPRDISETFPGLPGPTAAVYDNVEGKTYFFSGNKYWRYDENRQQFDRESQPVSNRFDGIPTKITGAFLDQNSKYRYLVKYFVMTKSQGSAYSLRN